MTDDPTRPEGGHGTITLALDGDRAGRQATLRAMEMFGFYSSFTQEPSSWPEAPPAMYTRSS